ncbi:hypothetical protein ACFE04_000634 [Oxalis oulophora]
MRAEMSVVLSGQLVCGEISRKGFNFSHSPIDNNNNNNNNNNILKRIRIRIRIRRRLRNEFVGFGAPVVLRSTSSSSTNFSFVDPHPPPLEEEEERSNLYAAATEINLLFKDDNNDDNNNNTSTKEEDVIDGIIEQEKENDDDDDDDDDLVPFDEQQQQMMLIKRSNLIAKQVISISSARTLGFVSQLWLDPNSWTVLHLEVRPNLLSGEPQRFHLHHLNQIGDVVLIDSDSSIFHHQFTTIPALHTLVGYNVVTPNQRNIGKVRGYTFNINSGAIVSLELDSFGVSIIPSTLDVLEVISDTVVVHEAAASHIHRLTKGLWGNETAVDEGGEYSDYETPVRYNGGRRFPKKRRENNIEWELPMDYL